MAKMDEEKIRKMIRRRDLEDTLRADCLRTISERVTRYLELNFTEIRPNEQPFGLISDECIRLYRDGHFFACIALCQAVAEALARFLCERSGWNATNDFEKNTLALRRRKKVTSDCYKYFKEIWKGRNDYHHLNPKVPTEREKLQAIAKIKMTALHSVESEVFAYELGSDGIKVKYPKYWPEAYAHNGKLFRNVFLRIEV
ncbi:MAG: hypothetical protein Q8O55_04165 [Dehalococcoidales bacterium]|nr:hypothetical protein [Dehalococcoidales bacterium]